MRYEYSSGIVGLIAAITLLFSSSERLAGVRQELERIERPRILSAADAYVSQPPVTIMAFSSSRRAGGIHDFFSYIDLWKTLKLALTVDLCAGGGFVGRFIRSETGR